VKKTDTDTLINIVVYQTHRSRTTKTKNWQIEETGIMHQMHFDKMMRIKFDISKLLSRIAALKVNMETYEADDNQ